MTTEKRKYERREASTPMSNTSPKKHALRTGGNIRSKKGCGMHAEWTGKKGIAVLTAERRCGETELGWTRKKTRKARCSQLQEGGAGGGTMPRCAKKIDLGLHSNITNKDKNSSYHIKKKSPKKAATILKPREKDGKATSEHYPQRKKEKGFGGRAETTE